MNSLVTNINQAISDFSDIKQAIIDKGVSVPEGTKTEDYGDLIRSIKNGSSGGVNSGESNKTILLNMPLTDDLSDVSGFDRTAIYTGDTPLTITADDGIYLYKDYIVIDGKFLSSYSKFTVEFDTKLNVNGTINSLYNREIIYIYNDYYGMGLATTSSSGIKIGITYRQPTNPTSIAPTNSTYNDQEWHHVILIYNELSKRMLAIIDDYDLIFSQYSMTVINAFSTKIRIGSSTQGLNGYIKNLKIKSVG